jgi:hypothetical protein
MPIQVFWDNPQKTILRCDFGETWTLEEYHVAIDDMHGMVTSVPHRVHIISDFSRSRTSPTGLLSAGPHIESRKPINMGLNVIIGAKGFIKSMLNVAQRLHLTDTRIELANSVEEGYQAIARQTLVHR